MQEELLQCFDEFGNPSEVQARTEIKAHPEKYYCGVVNVWLVNDQAQLLCSKRSGWVSGNPNKWQTYFGGHVTAGMSFKETAVKELEEEIGLRINENDLFFVAKGKDETHHQFFESYALRFNGSPDDLSFTDDEIVDAKWLDMDEYWKDRELNTDQWCNNCRPEQQVVIKKWIRQTA
ncbi:MAG: NUDIX domain-containing protein [bacterium]|nr:NUDIX domain-containing protein [bacterium]